jgi:hypothetical protein
MTRRSVLSASRVVFALIALGAIACQLIIQIRRGASIANFFSYFTNLSNLSAAIVLVLASRPRISPLADRVRAISAVNMAVVGIVFTVLLRNEDLGLLQPWVNFVLHYLMPCVVVLDWLLDPPSSGSRLGRVTQFLIFPAVYLVYCLIRGAQVGWYPYPFLNPGRVGGHGVVAAYAAGIGATFLLVGWMLLKLARWREPHD